MQNNKFAIFQEWSSVLIKLYRGNNLNTNNYLYLKRPSRDQGSSNNSPLLLLSGFPISDRLLEGTIWAKWLKTTGKLQNQHFWAKQWGRGKMGGDKSIFRVVGGDPLVASPPPPK